MIKRGIIIFLLINLLAIYSANGTVQTTCGLLTALNSPYVLGNDILNTNGSCFQISVNNVVFSGAGYRVAGNGSGTFINISTVTGIVIENVTALNFSHGMNITSTNNSVIAKNNISTISPAGHGILSFDSRNINITSNIINTSFNNANGIYILNSHNNTLVLNSINTTGANAFGILLNGTQNNSVLFNDINSTSGISIGFERTNTSVANNNTIPKSSSSRGIDLFIAFNNTFSGNDIKLASTGIQGVQSANNTFSFNFINSTNLGIYLLTSSENNTIYFNNINDSGDGSRGIVSQSNFNNISNNIIFDTGFGTTQSSAGNGIQITALNNTIEYNNVTINGTNSTAIYIIAPSTPPSNIALYSNILNHSGGDSIGILVEDNLNTNSNTFFTNTSGFYGSALYSGSNGILLNSTNDKITITAGSASSSCVGNIVLNNASIAGGSRYLLQSGANCLGTITFKWFVNVSVNFGNKTGVDVKIYNSSSVLQSNAEPSGTTNTNGQATFTVTELIVNNSGTTWYQNPISFLFNKSGFINLSIINLTTTNSTSISPTLLSNTSTSKFSSSNSTNLSALTDLSNVSNLVLESSIGRIRWHGTVNVLNLDLNQYANISSTFMSFDSANADSSLNGSAEVVLYNVSCPANPYFFNGLATSSSQISTSGTKCTSATNPACTNIACSNGVLSFNVTHFTSYGAVSTPASSTSTTSTTTSGGGGGGGVTPLDENESSLKFLLSREYFKNAKIIVRINNTDYDVIAEKITDKVLLTVADKQVMIAENESIKFDVTNDGIDDIEITITQIASDKKVKVKIDVLQQTEKKEEEPIIEQKAPVIKESYTLKATETPAPKKEAVKETNWRIYIIAGILIIISAGILVYVVRRR